MCCEKERKKENPLTFKSMWELTIGPLLNESIENDDKNDVFLQLPH